MLGQGVIALFDLDSWIAVMELVSHQLRLLWQHLIGKIFTENVNQLTNSASRVKSQLFDVQSRLTSLNSFHSKKFGC